MNNIIQWPLPYDSVDWGGRHRCHGDGGNWSVGGRASERRAYFGYMMIKVYTLK